MLGRRQIREKVIQTLYAYQQNPINTDALEKNMFKEIEKIYHLYIYQLNFLVALKDQAENQMEIGKQKYLRTEKDLHPNLKFKKNQVLLQLEANQERLAFTSKHKNLTWELHDDLLVKTYQRIVAGKRYQDYMEDDTISFEDDQKFIGKLFLRYVAENEDFHDRLEEMEMAWADDFHISNSMVQKTIGFMKENQPLHTLIKTIKDEEDRDFARRLLLQSLSHWEAAEKKVEERLENWDLERIALMDKIILVTAITEIDNFPLTPAKVIINEYIEVAKVFATDRSQIFVNGILDKYSKDISRT